MYMFDSDETHVRNANPNRQTVIHLVADDGFDEEGFEFGKNSGCFLS